MHSKNLIRALALAVGFLATAANATVVTFNTSADLTNNFTKDVFAGDSGTQFQNGYAATNGFSASSGNFIHFNNYNTPDSLRFIAGPVFLNGFSISSQYAGGGAGVSNADNNGRDYVLELYNSANSLISSQQLLVGAHGTWDFVTLDVANVSAIRILATWSRPGVYDGWWPNVDNITFNEPARNSNVPEPASIALLGLGLVGLTASRRRKQK